MKITATKIKRELVANYGWDKSIVNSFTNSLIITETLNVIDKIIKEQKGFSIKK